MNFLRKRLKAEVGPYLGDEPDKPSKSYKKGVSFLGVEVNNPFQFHCGPGNDILDEKSADPVDENCRLHDKQYQFMEVDNPGYNPKFYTSDADRQFISNQLGTNTVSGAVYALPFIIKNALAPEWPTRSFDKSKTMVKTLVKGKRRRRSRRSKKPVKQITRLQIYKAIGNRLQQRRACQFNLLGKWKAPAANQLSTQTTNNNYLCHVGTLNDFWHYQDLGEATIHGSQASSDINDPSANAPYFLNSYIKGVFSNFSNVNLVLTPVRVVAKIDLPNESGTYTGTTYQDSTSAQTFLGRLAFLCGKVMPASNASRIAVTNADPVGTPGSYGQRKLSTLEFPVDLPLPLKLMRKDFDIKFGKQFVLPVQQTITVNMKGHKGAIPSQQMLSATPSHDIAGATPRSPTIFAKKTVMYFYIVRPQSHLISSNTTQDVGEAYLGGPWRIAYNMTRVTDFVGIPATSLTNIAQRVLLSDYRGDAEESATPIGILDTQFSLAGVPAHVSNV